MLNLGTEWEIVETLWSEEKGKVKGGLPKVAPRPDKQVNNQKLGTQLNALDAFLQSARKHLQRDPSVAPNLLVETKNQRESLRKLADTIRQNSDQSPMAAKAQQLEYALDQFILQLESGDQSSNQVELFLQAADTILNQLEQMKTDLQHSSVAVANELGPLAKQKASSVIADGEQLLKHRQSSEDQQKVSGKLTMLREKIEEIVNLARQKIEGNSHLFEEVQRLAAWLRETAEPFLANNGNLGADSNSAQDFVQAHWTFSIDLINKESSVNSVLIKGQELSDEGREQAKFMYNSWENVKQAVEARIKLANTFKAAHKFGIDLDRSLQAIFMLLDQNDGNFGDETVTEQMNNLFYTVQSTLAQEKHQVEKFLTTAKLASPNDLHLNSDHAADVITASLSSHERKFEEFQQKWQDWQNRRQLSRTAIQTVEEVQLWQVDVSDLIGRLEQKSQQSNSEQVREEIIQTIRTLQLDEHTRRLDDAFQVLQQTKQHEQTVQRIKDACQQQDQLRRRVEQLLNLTTRLTSQQPPELQTVHHEVRIQQSPPDSRPPRLVSPLKDAQVTEGERFEFNVQVDGSPDPQVEWSKDGRDIRGNADYRSSFHNGLATLTIEETFVEDSAVYMIRVSNPLGSAEAAARLTVKSRTQFGQPVLGRTDGEDKPRFVRQLQNISVEEGSQANLECVIVAQPEPKVVWYHEEEVIRESDRIRLEYAGDRCALTIRDVNPQDGGLYKKTREITSFEPFERPRPLPRKKSLEKAKAQNAYGETTNFCRLNVIPPHSGTVSQQPPQSIGQRILPSFQPSLMNQVVREGEPATVQVRVIGQPTPQIAWTKDDQPIQESDNVQVTFETDGWTRVSVKSVGPEDIGLYMVTAINEDGEARTGATLNAIPSHVLQAGATTQHHHFNRGAASVSREHAVQLQQQQGPDPSTYTPVSQVDKQRMIQHKIIQEAASTRFPVSEEISDFGFSSLANPPQLIRPFAPEYTVNEGEKTKLDCLLIGNPRPKVQWFFNDNPIKSNWQFAEFTNVGDTYSIELSPAKLENAGYYRIVAENIRGKVESVALVHVRPRSMIPQPTPPKHTPQHRVVQDFGGTDYGIRHPIHQFRGTPPPQKRYSSNIQQMSASAYQPRGDIYKTAYAGQRQSSGQPPHFMQTLSSCVAITGDSSRFDAVVTGLPQPEIQWSKDGEPITPESHPHIEFMNRGSRVALVFRNAQPADGGKYMCIATNFAGVATSSAQFVVRSKTIAPDFAKRLISEELCEGDELRWTVKVSGEPDPKVTWLRNSQPIPNCEEVRLSNEGNGVHSLVIARVEPADGGQFTCVADNMAGEARSTADLVVRPLGAQPGNYFHVTKVTQEKQVRGDEVTRNQTFCIESPHSTPAR